jgi:hypothetical protein
LHGYFLSKTLDLSWPDVTLHQAEVAIAFYQPSTMNGTPPESGHRTNSFFFRYGQMLRLSAQHDNKTGQFELVTYSTYRSYRLRLVLFPPI